MHISITGGLHRRLKEDCPFFDLILAHHHCHGDAMHGNCIAMALPRQTMALPRQCRGTAASMAWQLHGSAMAVTRHCHANAGCMQVLSKSLFNSNSITGRWLPISSYYRLGGCIAGSRKIALCVICFCMPRLSSGCGRKGRVARRGGGHRVGRGAGRG